MRNFLAELDKVISENESERLRNSIVSKFEELLYIEDKSEEGKTVFVENANERCFKIENKNLKEILLWPIDGGFLGKYDKFSEELTRRCDCVFGFVNYLAFIEFKTSATSENFRKIKDNRNNAVEQLEHTLDYLEKVFKMKLTEKFKNHSFEAFICTPPHYPRQDTHFQRLSVRFLETYNIELFEKNEKIC